MFFFPEETMLKDQTADFVSSLAALLSTTRDQRQPAGEGAVVPILLESQLGFTQGFQMFKGLRPICKALGNDLSAPVSVNFHQGYVRAMLGI